MMPRMSNLWMRKSGFNIVFCTILCLIYFTFVILNDSENPDNGFTSRLKHIRKDSKAGFLKKRLDLSAPLNNARFSRYKSSVPCFRSLNNVGYLKDKSQNDYTTEDYRVLFRLAMDFAFEKINSSGILEYIPVCTFHGFTTQESEHIWHLAERKVRVDHSCLKFKSYLTKPPAMEDILWDTKNNLGYCYNFKVASTTWMSRLIDWAGKNSTGMSTRDIHLEAMNLFPHPGDMKPVLDRKPFVFTVSRHPFTRLVSSYKNRIEKFYLPPDSDIWIKDLRGKTLYEVVEDIKDNILDKYPEMYGSALDKLLDIPTKGVSEINSQRLNADSEDPRLNFREFTRLVIKQILECFNDEECLKNVDEHWQPQYIRCSPCNIDIDVMSTLNTFEQDTNLIRKVLKREEEASPTNGNKTSTKRILNSELQKSAKSPLDITDDYLEKLTEEEIKLLFIAYSYDFTLFGYNFNDLVV